LPCAPNTTIMFVDHVSATPDTQMVSTPATVQPRSASYVKNPALYARPHTKFCGLLGLSTRPSAYMYGVPPVDAPPGAEFIAPDTRW